MIDALMGTEEDIDVAQKGMQEEFIPNEKDDDVELHDDGNNPKKLPFGESLLTRRVYSESGEDVNSSKEEIDEGF
ncbi:hypothetical protein V6N11_059291 [Hibiscus sabdariffa]|uniref:Uncharacterized protein n=1 Tax=Hibiscus sabdariffa TaxID=183260 RepID=A0ABR2U7C6_9ROSI